LTAGSPLSAIKVQKRAQRRIVARLCDCALNEYNEPWALLPRRDIVRGHRRHKESRL
jgi:hypothetical protein